MTSFFVIIYKVENLNKSLTYGAKRLLIRVMNAIIWLKIRWLTIPSELILEKRVTT